MHNNITRDDLDLLVSYLQEEDPQLTHGPKVLQFEQAWSDWLGVKHSVMVNSGSSANDLTLLALREIVGKGEVIVPPLTWVSDIASVIHAGFVPKFVDINPTSLAMDPEEVKRAINSDTRAVFLTHVLGYDGIEDSLLEFLADRNIPLIEDVCESHGATHHGRKLGTFGWVSNFSFYYAHHLTTIEGGMICTDDSETYQLLRMLRSHGMVRENSNPEQRARIQNEHPDLNPDFIFACASHNMRPTELNGILGLSQLPRLDKNNLLRTRNLEVFLSGLNKELFRTDFRIEGSSNYALTLVLQNPDFELRNRVEELLRTNGVEFRRGLSGGGNQLRQPYLRSVEGLPRPEDLVNVEHVHNFGWYIGNYPELPVNRIVWLTSLLSELQR
jgi:CDP-6-deoxy-D-xylo-4-hexulose-3-dehydrase